MAAPHSLLGPTCFAGCIAFAVLAPSARAATQIQGDDFEFEVSAPISDRVPTINEYNAGYKFLSSYDDGSKQLSIPKFLSGYGTLTSVTVKVDAEFDTHFSISGAGVFAAEFETGISLNSPGIELAEDYVIPIDEIPDSGDFDLVLDPDPVVLTTGLSGYIGSGWLHYDAAGFAKSQALESLQSLSASGGIAGTLSGSLTITYTYTPFGLVVPEPTGLATTMAAAGLMVRRRRRSE